MGEYAGGGGNRDGFVGGLGRLTDGRVHSNPDGSLYDVRTGEAVASPGAPAKDAGRPTFRKDELDLIKEESDTSDIDAELDAEDVAAERNMLKLGMSKEEIARLRGRPVEQVGKPAVPVVTLASVERELELLSEMQRTDPKKFWGDEVQKRQLDLIQQQQDLKAGKATAKSETKSEAEAAKPEVDGIDAELAAIKKARRENPKSYTNEVAARELELIAAKQAAETAGLDAGLVEEWSNSGGVEHNLDAARATAQAVLDGLGPDDAAAFQSSFDALPETIRTQVFRHMAIDGGNARSATEEMVGRFGGIDDAAASLLESWGSRAGQRLGAAYARLDHIVSGLSEADQAAAHAWLGGLSPAQRTAVIRAMAK